MNDIQDPEEATPCSKNDALCETMNNLGLLYFILPLDFEILKFNINSFRSFITQHFQESNRFSMVFSSVQEFSSKFYHFCLVLFSIVI